MPRKIDLSEAKGKAGRFCAFQERSPKEVKDKLKTWGLSVPEINEIINFLLQEDYIDPQRFANAYCNDKFEFNSWGRLKIRANIYPHQLDAQVVEKALSRIDNEKYFDRLSELAKQKWNSLERDNDLKKKQKTVSYLANKGFEQDLIWKAIDGIQESRSE